MWLGQYADEVFSGRTAAGEDLKMGLSRLMSDLGGGRYVYDTREADRRIDFIENCVRLTKSPFYGQPMKLMLWQKAFIESTYSFRMREDGTRRFRRVLLEIARKNGKSEMCSGLLLAELCIGGAGKDIVCASNDDSQSSILYTATDVMRRMIDPYGHDTHKNQTEISNRASGTSLFKLSERTHNKEGRNIDEAIVDEVHEMKTNAIVKALEQSQSSKPDALLLMITSEGFIVGGFLDDEIADMKRVLKGESDGVDADRKHAWLFTQDSEGEIFQDPASWAKSNPSLGVIKQRFALEIQVAAARRSKAERVWALTKDFNWKVSAAELWLMEGDYCYDATFDIGELGGSLCLGAVDLAETTDLACAKVMVMKPESNEKFIETMYFIPESKLENSADAEAGVNAGAAYAEWARAGWLTVVPGNDIDVSAVADWFYRLYKEHGLRLVMCGYDQRFAKGFLRRMDDYGFETEVIWQNAVTMTNAVTLVEADLKDRRVNYNENPIDRWCFGNAVLKADSQGRVILAKTRDRSKRIDGAVTTTILYEVYRRYKSELLN
ncbi:MAG: terminase large subunit [Clostridiales Family XIII bacterium]|jgi:phage terminase large subunit-like protein|nr:terminase large subunit [Clostridiales Family XIII bacterium]